MTQHQHDISEGQQSGAHLPPASAPVAEPDKVPLFRRWRGWYWLLLIVLLIEVALFIMLTQYFS